jgi:hypothetical protein
MNYRIVIPLIVWAAIGHASALGNGPSVVQHPSFSMVISVDTTRIVDFETEMVDLLKKNKFQVTRREQPLPNQGYRKALVLSFDNQEATNVFFINIFAQDQFQITLHPAAQDFSWTVIAEEIHRTISKLSYVRINETRWRSGKSHPGDTVVPTCPAGVGSCG